jgi:hypothetical protein
MMAWSFLQRKKLRIHPQKIRIGSNDDEIAAAGLRCMGLSGGDGPANDTTSIATIRAALDAAITRCISIPVISAAWSS